MISKKVIVILILGILLASIGVVTNHNEVVESTCSQETRVMDENWIVEKINSPYSEANGISWKPDGSYALLVSSGDEKIQKYYPNNDTFIDLTYKISIPSSIGLFDVEWKPDGSCALIVGNEGYIYKFDGNTFVDLASTLNTTSWVGPLI